MKFIGKISSFQADVFLSPRACEELYKNDSDQIKNVVTSSGNKIYLINLRQLLSEWIDETGDDIPQNLTKDWYKKDAGTMKTSEFGLRGEMPGEKRHATKNNNKGNFRS